MNLKKSGLLIKTDALNLPLINHYAITLFIDNKLYVLENTPIHNSRIILFSEFIKGRTIEYVKPTFLCNKSNKYIIDKFYSCKKPYDLLNYNCEHFIDCMLSNNHNSEQVVNFVAICCAAFGIYNLKF